MTANNPHLPKKRSSRCALGRSIIRRIAEIPETVSRQCSREDKDGSFRSKTGNQSGSFRSAADTVSVSISYRSSMKTPSPSIRKSHSDHYHIREGDSFLRGSFLGTNAAKRSSRRSETDSLDIPPSVCKSASAQNLTIDTNLLHPDHTKLHKSWSLTSTTSIENRGCKVMTRSRQILSIGEQTRSALQSESFDKAEICPWDVEPEQSGDKSQKHVTYANSEAATETPPLSPQALVCPWDHLPPPAQNNSSEGKELQSESDSSKTKTPVSSSAPGSPRPKVMKDQRVFSLRTTTNRWLSVKSFMASTESENKPSKDGNAQKEDSATTTPRSGTSSRCPSIEKKTLQKRSLTTSDGKPCLVKQNAIRLSSGDSSDRSPRRLVVVKSAVHPWDVDDGPYENVFLSRQNSKRGSTSSWETASSCRTPSVHRRGSNRITSVRNVPSADVCPWDGAAAGPEGPKKQQSIKANICPWETQIADAAAVCPWESQEHVVRQGSARGNVPSGASKGIPVIYHTTASTDSQSRQPLEGAADICPWESADAPQSSTRQDHVYANVCPWEVQDKADAVYENLNPLEAKAALMVPVQQEVLKHAVYPGAPMDSFKKEQQSQLKTSSMHLTKTSESCPWDFPEPPKMMESICPWEEENPEPKKMTIKVDVCPWEAGGQDSPEVPQNRISSLEKPSVQAELRSRTDVCPWETEESKQPKVLTKQDSSRADVCPWETEEPKQPEVLTKQESSRTEVCLWETEKTEFSKTQDNAEADVCPAEAPTITMAGSPSPGGSPTPPRPAEPSISVSSLDQTGESKENLALSRRDALCPWEMDRSRSGSFTDNCSDVFTWEPENIPEEDEEEDAECAAEALVFPPDL